ncbi:hypothetical protein PHLCEN_2v4278 [Hermanssonia centrifuga]|uniref:C2H2-type domain-containing protein n=1 Tax=Hermanssonia centrifuga TaxID=98765 RepID=A0A2R6NZL9_9APHY|nr:hypothetical protein PHLCEN_2v6383 [Hermanssonia centrifuga]PSR97712.1 hypothetical protein PHLCEN_2v4278 [Hermanssonia centrifuga]
MSSHSNYGAACPYCNAVFPHRNAMKHHIVMSPACQLKLDEHHLVQRELWRANRQQGVVDARPSIPPISNEPMSIDTLDADLAYPDEDVVVTPSPRLATVEDLPEQEAEQYALPFAAEHQVGATFGVAKTAFDAIRDDQVLHGAEIWGPFQDSKQWELAKWLIKNVGHNQAEEFLKLGIIQDAGLDYPNKDRLYKAVDELPTGLDWQCKEVIQTGDLMNANGEALTETLEVWYRDPMDCIRELLGNPLFAKMLAYAPERVYHNKEGINRHIDKTWTGNWWWDLQKKMPTGTTIAPVILSSDKMRLSQFCGDKSAWPIYLTVGNLAKEVRRSPTMHGTVLLGYLPVGKLDCFSEGARLLARYQAFHSCMRIILDSLVEAGKSGAYITCADRQIRFVMPVLATYVADYPEQCLVSGCMENRCPTGQIAQEEVMSTVYHEIERRHWTYWMPIGTIRYLANSRTGSRLLDFALSTSPFGRISHMPISSPALHPTCCISCIKAFSKI